MTRQLMETALPAAVEAELGTHIMPGWAEQATCVSAIRPGLVVLLG